MVSNRKPLNAGAAAAAVAALLLALAGWARVPAQAPNGAGSQADAPAAQLPPEVVKRVKDLRESQDAAQASLRAEMLRSIESVQAREELLRLLGDPGLPEHVLGGILTCLEEANDRAPGTVDRLITLFCRSEGPRRDRLGLTLRRYDAKLSIAREPLARVRNGTANGERREFLDVAIALVDTPEERRDMTADLIGFLKAEKSPEFQRDLLAQLKELTFHSFRAIEEWEAWHVTFLEAHRAGFSEKDLANDAIESGLRAERDRFVADIKRALAALGQGRVLPLEFLDADRNPDPEVRAAAAAQFAVAATADEEKARLAVQRLVPAQETDPDAAVQRAAIAALGVLGKDHPKLRPEIVKAVLPRLADADLLTVREAVRALRPFNDPAAADGLADLYLELVKTWAEAELRSDVISALTGLKSKDHIIVEALKDKDKGVRLTAASCLAVSQNLEHALRLAEAFSAEKEAAVQQGLLASLVQLGNFRPPEVIVALRQAAERPALRNDAWVGLMDALAAPPERRPPEESCRGIAALLEQVYPQQDKATRTLLVEAFTERQKPELLEVVCKWWLAEPEESIRVAIAQVISRMPGTEPVPMLDLAARLVAAEFGASAETILRPLLSRATGEAGAPDAEQARAGRKLLIQALALQTRPEALDEADRLLTEALSKSAGDAALLLQRGLVRQKAKRPKAAIEDLRAVFESKLDALPGPERKKLVLALSGLYIEVGQPEESRLVLDRAEDDRTDRQLLWLRSATHLGLEHAQLAHALATEALAARGTVPADADLWRIQLQTGLRLRSPEARERAVSAFERLASPALPADLRPFEARVASDRRLRGLVEQVDRAADEAARGVAEAALLEAAPAEAGTWLVRGVRDLAAQGAAGLPAVTRRLALLKRLFPEAAPLQKLAAPADAAALAALSDQLVAWWSSLPN